MFGGVFTFVALWFVCIACHPHEVKYATEIFFGSTASITFGCCIVGYLSGCPKE